MKESLEIKMNINTQRLHATHDAEHGLTIYNNKDGYNDPFWKGVVIDDVTKQVVARSFQGSKTVVTEEVPEDLLYTPLLESTILRFYRHNGEPMISTHRQINVSNTSSRIGNGQTFITLVKQAIAGWDKRVQSFDHNGETGLAYTPTSWEDLCMEGWCHVFLLLDVSNQKTDLTDFKQFSGPQLLYALSLSTEIPQMIPYPTLPIFAIPPTEGRDIIDDSNDTTVYTYETFSIPILPVFDKKGAEELLSNGSAVIGFRYETKDEGTKFLSPSYNRKIRLANETTNPIHRWYELMDESEQLAREYLASLPTAMKYMNEDYMKQTAESFLQEATTYISEVVVDRYSGLDHPVSEVLEKRIKSVVIAVVAALRRKYSRGNRPPARDRLIKQVQPLVREELLQMTYSQIHMIRGRIARDQREQQ